LERGRLDRWPPRNKQLGQDEIELVLDPMTRRRSNRPRSARSIRAIVPSVRSSRRWTWVIVATALLVGGCTSPDPCAPPPPSPTCPDLSWRGVGYNEAKDYHGPPASQLQEVGDATYPGCNVQHGCPGSEFGDFGATDVWSLTGVDPADAVIGVRENSDKLVIFVRVGVKPGDLPLPAA
jgi:hypothetical protein